MNIFSFFFSFWGVLGKRTLNPEVLKCHEDRITLDTYVQQGKTMDNKFYINVKTLTSLAKWWPGGGGGGGGLQYSDWAHLGSHIPSSNLIRTF